MVGTDVFKLCMGRFDATCGRGGQTFDLRQADLMKKQPFLNGFIFRMKKTCLVC